MRVSSRRRRVRRYGFKTRMAMLMKLIVAAMTKHNPLYRRLLKEGR